MKFNYYLLPLIAGLLAACASTTPPSKPENMCEIVQEKPEWGKALEQSREKWGAPPQVILSIIYQESSFKHDAQPPMSYFLGIIPLGRKSSAYGYPQAKDEVWGDYKKQTQNSSADRDDFADAVDFCCAITVLGAINADAMANAPAAKDIFFISFIKTPKLN